MGDGMTLTEKLTAMMERKMAEYPQDFAARNVTGSATTKLVAGIVTPGIADGRTPYILY